MDTDAIPKAQSLEGAELKFPLSFDLRIIYVLAEGATITEDLQSIFAAHNVSCSLIQGIAKPGAKYGRMGSRVTFASRVQMYATYDAIAKLPYVKTAI
jgi:hypothetical protein